MTDKVFRGNYSDKKKSISVGELKHALEHYDDDALIEFGEIFSADKYDYIEIADGARLSIQTSEVNYVFYPSDVCKKYCSNKDCSIFNATERKASKERPYCCSRCGRYNMKPKERFYPRGYVCKD